jgi:hypothetical protein
MAYTVHIKLSVRAESALDALSAFKVEPAHSISRERILMVAIDVHEEEDAS